MAITMATKKTTTKKTAPKKKATKKSAPKKKATKKPVKKAAPKPVVEEPKEEEVTTDETESKVGVFFGKMKSEISKIPTDIDEPENKLQMTTSKLFALTGSIFAVFEGRALVLAYQNTNTPFAVVVGIMGVVFGLFMFLTLNIIDFSKVTSKKIPYKWYILMGLGILLVVLNRVVATMQFLKGGVCFMTGGFILLLQGYKQEKEINLKQIITLIGIIIGIYEGFLVGLVVGSWTAWLTSGVIWAMLVLLLLALLIPDKLPKFLQFEWWLVLTIGMAMLYLGWQLSGVVILHAFLLLLIDM